MNMIKHGLTKNGNSTRTYDIWKNMRSRCNSPSNYQYKYYEGRGIKVCPRWNVFTNFLEGMGEVLSDKHTLERINVNGNYEKENCKWATVKEQANNRRNNHKITIEGITKNLNEWLIVLGIINHQAFYKRYFTTKWSFAKAICTPKIPKKGRKWGKRK